METKEDENKKNLKYAGKALLSKDGNASLDKDIEIILEDIQNHWIYMIKKKIHLNTANDVYYAKKVDDHMEVGIAHVDFVR